MQISARVAIAGRPERNRRQASTAGSTHCGDGGRVSSRGLLRAGVGYICRVWVGGRLVVAVIIAVPASPFGWLFLVAARWPLCRCALDGRSVRRWCWGCVGLGWALSSVVVGLGVWMAVGRCL